MKSLFPLKNTNPDTLATNEKLLLFIDVYPTPITDPVAAVLVVSITTPGGYVNETVPEPEPPEPSLVAEIQTVALLPCLEYVALTVADPAPKFDTVEV